MFSKKLMKYISLYTLFSIIVFCTSTKGQSKTQLPKNNIESGGEAAITAYGPKNIARTIIQDRRGNIWIAAFDGIFRYDGKSFQHFTT
jgi:hypothetical protein